MQKNHSRALLRRWMVGIGLLAFAAALQVASDAYTADFASHPDEPAHFVTSAMVVRFLDHPLQNPLNFARNYYLQYPKVGMGHWPPLGYLAEGLWMRVVGIGRVQALLLILFAAAASALALFELLQAEVGPTLAVATAVLWLAHRYVLPSYLAVMMDIPVALLGLLALLFFRNYVARPSLRLALGFGLMAGLSLLIKPNAIVLAGVPLCFVVFARRWELLRRRDFWLTAVPPVLLAGPWYLYALANFYQNVPGWIGIPGVQGAADYFEWKIWWAMSGVVLLILVVAGLMLAFRSKSDLGLLWAALLASSLASNLAIRAMAEPRHLILALSAMLGLAMITLRRTPLPISLAGLAILAVSAWNWAPPQRYGYAEVARLIEQGPGGNVLLSEAGDGPIIASAVEAGSNSKRLWLRASKLMGEENWSGRVVSVEISKPEDVGALLAKFGINQVLADRTPRIQGVQFGDFLTQALEGNPAWQATELPGASQRGLLFRRVNPLPAGAVSFYHPRLRSWVGEAAEVP